MVSILPSISHLLIFIPIYFKPTLSNLSLLKLNISDVNKLKLPIPFPISTPISSLIYILTNTKLNVNNLVKLSIPITLEH